MTTLAASPSLVQDRSAASADEACAHCGLPVPQGMLHSVDQPPFCCSACDTAYHAIRGAGLAHYYEMRRAAETGEKSQARSRGTTYEEFDNPAFFQTFGATKPGGLHAFTLLVEGLHCAACIWLLERVPEVVPGVIEARVDFTRAQIELTIDPARTRLSEAARFIDRMGYALHPLRERDARRATLKQDREALIRIALAGALFGNTMVIAFALYGAEAEGMDPGMMLFLRATSGLLAAGSVLGPGWVFFRGALASLRVRALHMDVPIALALAVGLIHGFINTARAGGEVYFDTLCTLVFLLLIGRWIQQKQQRRAADAIALLFSLTARTARLVENAATREVPIEALAAGDLVEVHAGESVPVDGIVRAGRSAVNRALLTGESAPVALAEGDDVAAGFVNLEAPIRVETRATGRDTRIGQLMALVAEESRRRAPIVRLADRIAARFVAVVIALAFITFALWISAGLERAIEHTVSLLIITCPCALGLATPLAIVASLGRAAREGVLIKGGDAVEALAGKGTIVLDKTGTLTTGKWRVMDYAGPERLKPLIAAAEAGCNHPAARAIHQAFASTAISPSRQLAIHVLGGGVTAHLNGSALTVGSERFLREQLPSLVMTDYHSQTIERFLAQGWSVVLAAENGTLEAVIALGDEPRPESAACLQRLRALGWRTRILSGDASLIAAGIGDRLGFSPDEVQGDATPDTKARVVRELASKGPTVMVGDGVNDAAALAAATVGVAVHGGAEAAMATADVYLASPGLEGLVALIERARAATGAIRVNLIASLLYNVVFGGLAIAGLVNPLLAAVLMPLSSLTVIFLSLRPMRRTAKVLT